MVNHLIVAGDVSPEPIVGVQSQSRKADVGVSPIMANSAFLGAFCFAVGAGVAGVTGVTGEMGWRDDQVGLWWWQDSATAYRWRADNNSNRGD